MKHKTADINLLRHQEKPFIDKFFNWAFTVGRGIVIITQFIALSAFAYRFVLDRQIIDLTDSIKKKQIIVKLSEGNEARFRNLQSRLDNIDKTESTAYNKIPLLNQILESARGQASFTTINITNESVVLNGAVPSISSLNTFVSNLNAVPEIGSVRIDKILSSQGSGNIGFNITASINLPK